MTHDSLRYINILTTYLLTYTWTNTDTDILRDSDIHRHICAHKEIHMNKHRDRISHIQPHTHTHTYRQIQRLTDTQAYRHTCAHTTQSRANSVRNNTCGAAMSLNSALYMLIRVAAMLVWQVSMYCNRKIIACGLRTLTDSDILTNLSP